MSLFPRTWNVRRHTSTEVLGEASVVEVPGTFVGSVQPLSAKDLSLRPEGRLDTGRVKVYTMETLGVGEEAGTAVGDLVEYGGRWYEITSFTPYLNGLLPHNKYEAVLRPGA